MTQTIPKSSATKPLLLLHTSFCSSVLVKGDGENGDYSKSELTFKANRTDNGKAFSCHASNAATTEDLIYNVTIQVLFKPAFVKITADPEQPKAGQKTVLTCESGSSNPPAKIRWRYKKQYHNGTSHRMLNGEFGGKINISMLEINVEPEDDGEIIICEAINEELRESVHNAHTLSVKCKYKYKYNSTLSILSFRLFKTPTLRRIYKSYPLEFVDPCLEKIVRYIYDLKFSFGFFYFFIDLI